MYSQQEHQEQCSYDVQFPDHVKCIDSFTVIIITINQYVKYLTRRRCCCCCCRETFLIYSDFYLLQEANK